MDIVHTFDRWPYDGRRRRRTGAAGVRPAATSVPAGPCRTVRRAFRGARGLFHRRYHLSAVASVVRIPMRRAALVRVEPSEHHGPANGVGIKRDQAGKSNAINRFEQKQTRSGTPQTAERWHSFGRLGAAAECRPGPGVPPFGPGCTHRMRVQTPPPPICPRFPSPGPLRDVTARPQCPPLPPGPGTPPSGTGYVRRRGWIQDRTRPGGPRSSRATAATPVRTAGAAGPDVRLPLRAAAAARGPAAPRRPAAVAGGPGPG